MKNVVQSVCQLVDVLIIHINSFCPNKLKKYNSNNQVIACYSACEKFQTDQYCCRGAFGLLGTWESNTWPINYSARFKSACPDLTLKLMN